MHVELEESGGCRLGSLKDYSDIDIASVYGSVLQVVLVALSSLCYHTIEVEGHLFNCISKTNIKLSGHKLLCCYYKIQNQSMNESHSGY